MKKLLWGTILLGLVLVVPIPAMANGRIGIRVSGPPPIVFSGPPEMVVIPGTYIYVVPDSDVDVFFYDGWWWRPWQGRWYRSQNYSSGWGYYQSVPSFYVEIPSGWRNDYREHRWQGHAWNYQRIPHQQVQVNWNTWEKTKHWEQQNTWGVQDYRSQPPSREIQQPSRENQPSRAVQPYNEPKQSGEVNNKGGGKQRDEYRGDRGNEPSDRGNKNNNNKGQGRGGRH
jgi:hypothetical protein